MASARTAERGRRGKPSSVKERRGGSAAVDPNPPAGDELRKSDRRDNRGVVSAARRETEPGVVCVHVRSVNIRKTRPRGKIDSAFLRPVGYEYPNGDRRGREAAHAAPGVSERDVVLVAGLLWW